MRVLAPTLRTVHLLVVDLYSTFTRMPYLYSLYSRNLGYSRYGRSLIRPRPIRIVVIILTSNVRQNLFPYPVSGHAPTTFRQRDLIRRRVRVLLNALGDTPQAIEARLARLHTIGDLSSAPEWYTPLEAYLHVRLGQQFDVGLPIIKGDAANVVTPKAIRHYIRYTLQNRSI